MKVIIPYPARHPIGEVSGIVPGKVTVEKTDEEIIVTGKFKFRYNGNGTILRKEISKWMTMMGMGLGVLNEKK